MRGRPLRAAVAAAALVAGCTNAAAPPHDNVVRIVDLNAAMGYMNLAANPLGTDATTADLALLAEDILGQRGDVANLQEMALPAAKELRTILGERTGDEWAMNFSFSGDSTFFTGRKGETGPRQDYRDVPTGNAQLIRIGDGITSQRPLTDDGKRDDGRTPDQGILLPSAGRSFVGAEITTAHGTVAVYNTHLALARQVSDAVRAGDVRRIQELTEARPGPSVVTGDFNQTIDDPPDRSPETAAAIRAFMDTYGYTDVARDQGPTIDEKHRDRDSRRIDFILVRGVGTTDTVRFESHESDHWGLATTLA